MSIPAFFFFPPSFLSPRLVGSSFFMLFYLVSSLLLPRLILREKGFFCPFLLLLLFLLSTVLNGGPPPLRPRTKSRQPFASSLIELSLFRPQIGESSSLFSFFASPFLACLPPSFFPSFSSSSFVPALIVSPSPQLWSLLLFFFFFFFGGGGQKKEQWLPTFLFSLAEEKCKTYFSPVF